MEVFAKLFILLFFKLNLSEAYFQVSKFKISYNNLFGRAYETNNLFNTANFIDSRVNIPYMKCLSFAKSFPNCNSVIYTKYNDSANACSTYKVVPLQNVDLILTNTDMISQKITYLVNSNPGFVASTAAPINNPITNFQTLSPVIINPTTENIYETTTSDLIDPTASLLQTNSIETTVSSTVATSLKGLNRLTLSRHTAKIISLAVLANGDLASGSNFPENKINIWNPTDGTLKATLANHTNSINALIGLKNGDLVSGSMDMSIKIWNLNTYTARTSISAGASVYSLAILLNGDIVGGLVLSIKIWNSNNGSLIRTITGHSGVVNVLTLLSNGNLVSGCSIDNTIKIWNPTDGTLIISIPQGSSPFGLAILQNGNIAVGYGLTDFTVKIWNSNGIMISTLSGHTGSISSLAVLFNGDLVSGSYDYSIKIWDANSNWSLKKTISFGSANTTWALGVLLNGELACAVDKHIGIYN